MIYLDNAATSHPKPPNVYEGATRFLQTLGANPGRGGHRMAVGANRVLEETRLELARFVHAGATPERRASAWCRARVRRPPTVPHALRLLLDCIHMFVERRSTLTR